MLALSMPAVHMFGCVGIARGNTVVVNAGGDAAEITPGDVGQRNKNSPAVRTSQLWQMLQDYTQPKTVRSLHASYTENTT